MMRGPARAVHAACAADKRCSSLAGALDALGEIKALDPVAGPVGRAVRGLPLGPVRDVLRGRWLGHPLHPVLVQMPIGSWTSAAVLDAVPGAQRGANLLVAVGTVAAVPAVFAGWVDWADQYPHQQRTGLVHAVSNALAVGLYAGSWTARARGRQCLGRALGFAGLTAASVGGLIGGHLAYRQSAGPNKAEPVPHLLKPGWYALGRPEEYPEGQGVREVLGDEVPVLVVREAGGEVRVLAERCSHLSGPLSQGEIAEGCVTCPWHGSVFRLSDGWNVRGPATAPQPSFETRLREDGVLEVRLPEAG
jgi:nitrite reductase/ring-hydroxylating ferredoxin subunit/uncharacterized membrane protein